MHGTTKLLLLMHMFVMGNLEFFFGGKNQITSFLKFVRYRNPHCCILYGNEGRLMVVSNCSFPYDFSFKWPPERPSICRCSLKILIMLYNYFFLQILKIFMATNLMHRLSAYKSFNPLHLLYVIYRMMVKSIIANDNANKYSLGVSNFKSAGHNTHICTQKKS